MSEKVGDDGVSAGSAGGNLVADGVHRRTLLELLDEAICRLDADGCLVAATDELGALTGRPSDELLGGHFGSLLVDDDAARVQGLLAGLREGALETTTAEVAVATADGQERRCELRLRAVGGDDSFQGTMAVVRPGVDDEDGQPGAAETRDELVENHSDGQGAQGGASGAPEAPGATGESLDSVLERITDAVFGLDDEWRFTYLNDRAERFLGRPEAELLGEEVWEAFPEAVGSAFEEKYREAMETQEPIGFEEYFPPLETWFDVRAYPSEQGLSVYFRDVTDRTERERELELFRELLDHSNDGVVVLDPETGQYVDVNETACRRRGYSREEFLELSATDLLTEFPDRDAWESFVEQLRTDGQVTFESSVQRKDGTTYPAESSVSFVELEQEYVLAVTRDVTERRRVESELQEVLGRVTDAFYALDEEWRFTHVNDRAEELIDFEGEGLVGEHAWETFEVAADSKLREEYERAMETQEPTSFEYYYPEPLETWYEIHAYPSETGLSVYFRDVTDDHQQRRRLEVRERALREIHKAISDDTLSFEETLDDLLGIVREAVGTKYATLSRVEGGDYHFEFIHPAEGPVSPGDVVPLEATNCERTIETERTLVLGDLERDAPELAERAGNVEWGVGSYLGAPVFVDGDVYGTFCFYDEGTREESFSEWEVTLVDLVSRWIGQEFDRRGRERQLRRNEEKFRTLAENLSEVVWMTTGDLDDLLYINPAYEEVWGRSRESLYEEPRSFLDGVHPEDRERIREALSNQLAGDYDETYRVIQPDGEVRWVRDRAVPVTHDDGEGRRVVGIAEDVTERRAIRERLERNNRTLQRLLDVTSDAEAPFEEKLEDVLEIGRDYLDLDAGFLATVDEEHDGFEIVDAVGGDDRLQSGTARPLSETYCRQTLEEEGVLGILDAPAEGWTDDPAYDRWKFSSYLGAAVRIDGDLYGTLGFVDRSPRESPYTDTERTFLELAAQWVSQELERVARERNLQEYREYTADVLDAIDDVFYTVDAVGGFQRWNDTVGEVSGYADEEIAEMHVLDFFPEEHHQRIVEAIQEALEAGSSQTEAPVLQTDGTEVPYEFVSSSLTDPDGEPVVAGIGRDITDRLAREHQLEQYRALTEAASDVIVTIDATSTIQAINPAVEEIFGYDPEELLGESLTTLMPDELEDQHREALARYLETGEQTLDWDYVELPGVRADGSDVPLAVSFSEVDHDGERYFTGIVRDITERREYEAELERRQRQQAAVAELGQLALETDDLDHLMHEASERVADVLGTDYCKVLDLNPDAGELLLRQGVGWQDGIVGSATVGADESSQAGYTLLSEQPVVVEDLGAETRFSGPELLTSHDVTSGVSTVIGSVDQPWGILGTHDTDRREFGDEDVDFVQSVANVLATAVERTERERQLAQQRERLEALNRLHEVIRETTEAVIEQSTREEIERIVCGHLAETYEFVWIGEVDAGSETVVPRASGGENVAAYLHDIEVSVDPDDELSAGPTGQAFLTGETQTTRNIPTDPQFEPWREAALEYGFRSSAAIPIVHEDTVFGVLNLYADRPDAFSGVEGEIVSQLGEVVGHAIASVERKRALMSDEVLEVEFRIQDAFAAYDVPDVDGTITFDRVIPIAEDEYHVYGTTSGASAETMERLAAKIPYWISSTVVERTEDECRFEVVADAAPLVERVATHGGVVDTAVVDDGDLQATVHLPQGTEVRELIEVIREEYPGVEMLARRQVTRSLDASRDVALTLTEELTDRQRMALETAYHAGFYEWPRGSSGKDIAEQLDISPATFTQHLRAAERKLFETLFEELPTSG